MCSSSRLPPSSSGTAGTVRSVTIRPPSESFPGPFGTPLPLGFLALALASVTFSGVELDWVPASQAWVAGLVAVALTAPLQLLSSVLGFLSRDPVAGTGTGIISGTWAVVGVATLITHPGARTPALGLFLLVAATVVAVPVAAGASTPLAAAVMALSGLRFAVTGVSQIEMAHFWKSGAGVLGIGLALVAVYAALAFELEAVHGHPVLPTGRQRGAARRRDQCSTREPR